MRERAGRADVFDDECIHVALCVRHFHCRRIAFCVYPAGQNIQIETGGCNSGQVKDAVKNGTANVARLPAGECANGMINGRK